MTKNPSLRGELILSVASTAAVLCFAACAAWFALFTPPAGTPVEPAGLLSTVVRTSGYPRLSRERETLLTRLALLSAPLALAGVFATFRFLSRLPEARVRLVGTISQGMLCILILSAAFVWKPERVGWNWLAEVFAGGITVLMLRFRALPDSARAHRFAAAVNALALTATALGLAYMLLSVLQFRSSIRVPWDLSITVDDMLGASFGLHSLGDGLPMYSALFGEIVSALAWLGVDPLFAALMLLNILALGILLSLYLVFRLAGLRARFALTALVFCYLCTLWPYANYGAWGIGGQHFAFYANGFDYPQLMPVRYFAPFVTALLVVTLCNRLERRLGFVLGFLLAFFAVNEPTFGLGSAGIGLATLAIAWLTPLRRPIAWRPPAEVFGFVAAGAALGLVVIVAQTLIVTGALPRLDSVTHALRLYAASGVLMLPIALIWNQQAAVYLIFLFAFSLGVALPADSESRTLRGALLYFGMFGFLACGYYLNRPVVGTLIESTFIIVAICLVLVLAAFPRFSLGARHFSPIEATCIVLVVALSFRFIAVWTIPSEVARLAHGLDVTPSLWAETPEYNEAGREMERFIATHRAGPEVVIVNHLSGRIGALEFGMHDVNPNFSVMKFQEEVDRLAEVARKRGCPPIYANSLTPPELLRAIAKIGYVRKVNGEGVGLYEAPRMQNATGSYRCAVITP